MANVISDEVPISEATKPDHLFVVTGGPGSGKSTLVEALERAGYACSIEAGRSIIQDQSAIGGSALPWCDPSGFAELMLSWEMRSHRMARDRAGPVFFDRGVPDVLGYLRLVGLPVPKHMVCAAETFRYNRRVFIAPPWPEIFERDSERKQTFEESQRTYDAMVATYGEYGYELVELPCSTVEERVHFVIRRVGTTVANQVRQPSQSRRDARTRLRRDPRKSR